MGLFEKSKKCPLCGAKLDKLVNFCNKCGGVVDRERIECQACGTLTPVGKYCNKCGKPLLTQPAATVVKPDLQWHRGAGDLAARSSVMDIPALLRNLLKKKVIIQEGTMALFIQQGKFHGELGPGAHFVNTLFQTMIRNKPAEVVYFDISDINLRYQFEGVVTGDPARVSLDFAMTVKLTAPRNFYVNIMKARNRVSIFNVQSEFEAQARDVVQSVLSRESIKAFVPKMDLARRLERSLRSALSEAFGRIGLSLVRIADLSCRSETGEEILEKQIETFRDYEINQAKLEQCRKLTDQEGKLDLTEIERLHGTLTRAEKRALLQDQYDKTLTKEKAREIKNAREYDAYLRQIEIEIAGKEFLQDAEREYYKNVYETKKGSYEQLKEHTLKKMGLEQRLECDELEALGELSIEDKKLDKQLEMDLKTFRAGLQKDREAFEREQQELWELHQTSRKIEIDRMDAEREKEKIRDEIEKIRLARDLEEKQKKFQMGQLAEREMALTDKIERLEALEAQKAEDEHALKMKWEHYKLAHQAELDQLRNELDKARGMMEIERDRIEALSKASVETLISISEEEQARMLKDLASTRAMKDLTEEQILAMNAKESPQAAEFIGKAFQEKFKQMGSEQVEEMYKTMLADKDKTYQDFTRMFKETFEKALETQRDTAVATAQGSTPKILAIPGGVQAAYPVGGSVQNVVAPPQAPPQAAPPASGVMTQSVPKPVGVKESVTTETSAPGEPEQISETANMVKCPKCDWSNPDDSNFCQSCGHKMNE